MIPRRYKTGLTPKGPVEPKPSTARRPAHRPSRRDDVLAAGTVEFVERGFASVSVTDIAKRAGMTPAAVYYHFPTKEDVLLAIVGRTGDAISAPGSDPLSGTDP